MPVNYKEEKKKEYNILKYYILSDININILNSSFKEDVKYKFMPNLSKYIMNDIKDTLQKEHCSYKIDLNEREKYLVISFYKTIAEED